MIMSYLCLRQDIVIFFDNVSKWRYDFSKRISVSSDRRIMSLFVLLFALLCHRSFSGKLVISKISINLC